MSAASIVTLSINRVEAVFNFARFETLVRPDSSASLRDATSKSFKQRNLVLFVHFDYLACVRGLSNASTICSLALEKLRPEDTM